MKSLPASLNTILLVAILVTLLLIWRRMPPTMADVGAANKRGDMKEIQRLNTLRPMVQASCDIDQPLQVTVEEPLNVVIPDQPISVTIER